MRKLTDLEKDQYNDIKYKYNLFCNTFFKDSFKPTIQYRIIRNKVYFNCYLETLADFKTDKGYLLPKGYKESFIKGCYYEVVESIKTYANMIMANIRKSKSDYEKSL